MVLGIPKRALIIAAILVGVALVYIMGNAAEEPGGGESPGANGGDSPGCQFTVSADILNVRSSPSTGARIVGKVEQEATVDARPTVRNGFRKLDEQGWVAEEYLTPVDDASCD